MEFNADSKENLSIFALLQNIQFFKDNAHWIIPIAKEIMTSVAERQDSTQKKFDSIGVKINELIDQSNTLENKIAYLEIKLDRLEEKSASL